MAERVASAQHIDGPENNRSEYLSENKSSGCLKLQPKTHLWQGYPSLLVSVMICCSLQSIRQLGRPSLCTRSWRSRCGGQRAGYVATRQSCYGATRWHGDAELHLGWPNEEYAVEILPTRPNCQDPPSLGILPRYTDVGRPREPLDPGSPWPNLGTPKVGSAQ